MNTLFKIISLAVGTGILIVLFCIYQRLGQERYQVVGPNDFGIMFDKKTNEFYSVHEGKWHKMKVDGYSVDAKTLPQ